jgi:hypothetical protein
VSDLSFSCPYCDTQTEIPEDIWYYTCASCGKRLDLASQFAFLRGLEAFKEGQDIWVKMLPRKRRIPGYEQDRKAISLFMEAYSSLQVAFKADLADTQRALGVQMMSSMVNEFIQRNMISTFEMSYWNSLLVEQNSQKEYDQLKEKLSGQKGPLDFLLNLRTRSRQKRLVKALAELDQRIRALEKKIEFIDVPRARSRSWVP